MSASRHAALFVFLALAGVPARAQTPAQTGSSGVDAVTASVMQVLSLATMGTITVREQAAAVTQDGSNYRVRLPLSGFSAPSDAAVTAVGRPLDHGRVDITSMTFPSSGTIETALANGKPNRIDFTIGRQSISAKVDPTLAMESRTRQSLAMSG